MIKRHCLAGMKKITGHCPGDRRRPHRVWVSEIMLQQTRVEAVKPYFARFMEALPDIQALAQCPQDRLLKLWEGLGTTTGYLEYAGSGTTTAIEKSDRELCRRIMKTSCPEMDRTLPDLAGAVASIAYGKCSCGGRQRAAGAYASYRG
ncbi:MAG: hypothetical protein V8R46_03525 [Eubacterium ramulus]